MPEAVRSYREEEAEYVIRRAEPSDLEGALDAYESVAAEGRHIGGEPPIDRARRGEKWAAQWASDAGATFVAEANGVIIGTASMQGRGPSDLGMLVVKGWRGRGIGSALLAACIEWARAVGSHKVTLQVWPHNESALALYRRFGFRQEGYLRRQWPRRNGEIWDSVVMGLLLE